MNIRIQWYISDWKPVNSLHSLLFMLPSYPGTSQHHDRLAKFHDRHRRRIHVSFTVSACKQELTPSPYSGGLEMLFDNKNKHKISIPAKDPNGSAANIEFLVSYLCNNLLKDSRKELFVVDGSVY